MTLEKIRAALPTHIMLTPGVHKLKVGDEEGYEDRIEERDYWARIHDSLAGLPVNTELTRRPIPPHILDNQAWWVLYDRLGTVPPKEKGHILLPKFGGIVPSFAVDCFGERKFPDDEHAYQAVIHLGGDKEVIKRLTEGRLYDKWLLEQMEDV